MEIVCQSIDQLPGVAEKVFEFGKDFRIWYLKGEMGAGKTTFVNALVGHIGTNDQVSSPSYSLVNEYELKSGEKLYHFDFFRINSVTEIFDLGFEEYLDHNTYCLIEWPELIEPYLSDKHLEIYIEVTDGKERIYKIKRNE